MRMSRYDDACVCLQVYAPVHVHACVRLHTLSKHMLLNETCRCPRTSESLEDTRAAAAPSTNPLFERVCRRKMPRGLVPG